VCLGVTSRGRVRGRRRRWQLSDVVGIDGHDLDDDDDPDDVADDEEDDDPDDVADDEEDDDPDD